MEEYTPLQIPIILLSTISTRTYCSSLALSPEEFSLFSTIALTLHIHLLSIIIKLLQLLLCKLHIRSFHILLHSIKLRRPRNRNNMIPRHLNPLDRNLSRRTPLLLGYLL